MTVVFPNEYALQPMARIILTFYEGEVVLPAMMLPWEHVPALVAAICRNCHDHIVHQIAAAAVVEAARRDP